MRLGAWVGIGLGFDRVWVWVRVWLWGWGWGWGLGSGEGGPRHPDPNLTPMAADGRQGPQLTDELH